MVSLHEEGKTKIERESLPQSLFCIFFDVDSIVHVTTLDSHKWLSNQSGSLTVH